MCLPSNPVLLLAQVFKVFAQLCPAAGLRAVLVAGKVSQVKGAALQSRVPLLAGFCVCTCMAPHELVAWLQCNILHLDLPVCARRHVLVNAGNRGERAGGRSGLRV